MIIYYISIIIFLKLPKKFPFKIHSKLSQGGKNFYDLIYKSIKKLHFDYFKRDYLPLNEKNTPPNLHTVNDDDDRIFKDKNDSYEKSIFNLFLWALLTNKFEIAKIFLKLSPVR